ncbi:unnamed protein product [Prunus armeniaca]|uniref:Uncharacterized protein n=1 Tax=Prunus armeniaca TaxID=36596 RepID=A0A6J5VUU1_PRUAR|nr:hypothetical protein GBA52_028068 [Prunus armeniaca]CAB4291632.1 unnamed protein product [Prunus armeniaca]
MRPEKGFYKSTLIKKRMVVVLMIHGEMRQQGWPGLDWNRTKLYRIDRKDEISHKLMLGVQNHTCMRPIRIFATAG